MFFPTSKPGSPDPRRFVALRTSLNAPVVSTEEIPSGPARAAIAMWFEDDQSCSLEVRVRSVATGRMVVYAWEGDLGDAREVETALDAGLSFAESMGFLFDDDVLSSESTIGREMVIAAWEAFEAGEPAPRRGRERLGSDAGTDAVDAELLELTDLAAVEELGADRLASDAPLDVEPASGWEPDEAEMAPELPVAPAAAPEPPVAATLSKFRGRLEPPEESRTGRPEAARPVEQPPAAASKAPKGSKVAKASKGMKAALGRVPLVRRRRAGVETAEPKPERGSLLARILSAF